jgi:hypothetical protein
MPWGSARPARRATDLSGWVRTPRAARARLAVLTAAPPGARVAPRRGRCRPCWRGSGGHDDARLAGDGQSLPGVLVAVGGLPLLRGAGDGRGSRELRRRPRPQQARHISKAAHCCRPPRRRRVPARCRPERSPHRQQRRRRSGRWWSLRVGTAMGHSARGGGAEGGGSGSGRPAPVHCGRLPEGPRTQQLVGHPGLGLGGVAGRALHGGRRQLLLGQAHGHPAGRREGRRAGRGYRGREGGKRRQA